jgi:hypothetical protein
MRSEDADMNSASLKVSYLHDPDLEAVSDLVPSEYPSKLVYGPAVSAQDDIDISRPQEADAETVVSQTPLQRPLSRSSTVSQIEPSANLLFNQIATPLPTSVVAANRKKSDDQVPADDDANTQSSVVPRMKTALNGMMYPEHMTQGDTQTQGLIRPPAAVSRVAESPPQNGKKHLPSQKMVLLPKVTQSLEAERSQLRKAVLAICKKAGMNTNQSEIVLCQCGHGKEEDAMVSTIATNRD